MFLFSASNFSQHSTWGPAKRQKLNHNLNKNNHDLLVTGGWDMVAFESFTSYKNHLVEDYLISYQLKPIISISSVLRKCPRKLWSALSCHYSHYYIQIHIEKYLQRKPTSLSNISIIYYCIYGKCLAGQCTLTLRTLSLLSKERLSYWLDNVKRKKC